MNRITLVEMDYTVKPNTIKVFRTDNGYKTTETYDDKNAMHKRVWYVAHSPKLLGVTIKTNYYSKDIQSLLAYFNMINLPCTVITPSGNFNTTAELNAWFSECQHEKDMMNLTQENINLIINYARELMPFAKNGTLTEVLESQIRLSGYDVSMSSEDITDGKNHGTVETAKGKESWSRTYTKHYTRYNTQLNDLLKMYISCKWYAQHDISNESNPYGISTNDVDEYTGEVITEAIQIDLHKDDVVVPVSACGEYTQMLMN